MSAQFRKSKKVGPFKVTASKSGLSLSTGAGPLRWSANTRGEIRRTTRLPGTGVYSTKKVAQLSGNKTAKSTPQDSDEKAKVTRAEYKTNMVVSTIFFAIVAAIICGILSWLLGFSWWIIGIGIAIVVIGTFGAKSTYEVVDEELEEPVPPGD